jgi:coenzyme PQQ precursor peptide PqqA
MVFAAITHTRLRNTAAFAMLHCGLWCSARKRDFLSSKLHPIPHILMTKQLANLLPAITLTLCRIDCIQERESIMAWKAPKIVEVAVGMEINMYACAARK